MCSSIKVFTLKVFGSPFSTTNQIRNYARWAHRRPRRVFSPEGKEIKDSFIKPEINWKQPQHLKTTEPIIDMNEVDGKSEINKKPMMKAGKNVKPAVVRKKIGTDMLKTVIDTNGNFVYTKMKNNDPTIGKLMVIVKSRRERMKNNIALLEGKRLIKEALMAKCKLETLIFSRTSDVEDMKDYLPKLGADIYKIPYNEIQVWSDLTTTPGIMGIFKTPNLEDVQPAENSLPLTVICDNVREPGNLGSILRVSAGAGARNVILTKGCVDLWDTKVLRSAAGAHFSLPIKIKQSWRQINETIKPNTSVIVADNRLVNEVSDFQQLSGIISSLPLLPYYGLQFEGLEVAVIIGGETEGLSEDSYKLAHNFQGVRVHIPLNHGVESLNTGVALGVIAFEIKRQLSVCNEFRSSDVNE